MYVVWDGDHKDNDAKLENKYLLRLLNQPEEDWPDFVGDSCACFKTKLEKTLEDEVGKDLFARLLSEAKKKFEITKKEQALKNAAVIQHIVENAVPNGKNSETLKKIVDSIMTLKTQTEASV